MVKIRLTCLPEEVAQARDCLQAMFNVTCISNAYRNRGADKNVRVYVEAELPALGSEEHNFCVVMNSKKEKLI